MDQRIMSEIVKVLARLFPQSKEFWESVDNEEALQEAIYALSVRDMLFFCLGVESHFGVTFIPEEALSTVLMAMSEEAFAKQVARGADMSPPQVADLA